MCLTTQNPTIKVANKDITVYKQCGTVKVDSCEPLNLSMVYQAGKENAPITLAVSSKNIIGETTVEAGYHSYNKPNYGTNTKFIIPKGTSYIDGYYNSDNSIANRVSENIIYVGPRKYNFLERVLVSIGLLN